MNKSTNIKRKGTTLTNLHGRACNVKNNVRNKAWANGFSYYNLILIYKQSNHNYKAHRKKNKGRSSDLYSDKQKRLPGLEDVSFDGRIKGKFKGLRRGTTKRE